VERLAGICPDNELPDRSSLLKKHDVIKLIAHTKIKINLPPQRRRRLEQTGV
jgi:hypothetical protein